MSGEGDDTLKITSGACHIDGGTGDDSIHIVSADTARVYAGPGDDSVRGGAGLNFIDGGPGNDILIGGSGHTILSGGEHNDTLKAGSGTHVIYPGEGHNAVSRLKPIDKVYGLPSDSLVAITDQERREWMIEKLSELPAASAEQLLAVLMPDDFDAVDRVSMVSNDAGKTGLTVIGSPMFIARVEADLSLLRLSPKGQKLLHALDVAARASGVPISITYFDLGNARFTPVSLDSRPTIRDGQPGVPDYGGRIDYNPFFAPRNLLPIVGLYHELCHAYNAVTGTVAAGQTVEIDGDKSVSVNNVERQAVGLPIDMDPFDFDLDPTTPPTQTNPEAFTENGIRRELGLPLRTAYRATNIEP